MKEFTKPAKVPAATDSNKVSCPGYTCNPHFANSLADITTAVTNGIVQKPGPKPLYTEKI